jgi:hypothetical protein
MLTPQQLVVNRFPAAKFLSNTNAQCAGFAAGGDVSGKSQSGEFPRCQNRKIASLTPVSFPGMRDNRTHGQSTIFGCSSILNDIGRERTLLNHKAPV